MLDLFQLLKSAQDGAAVANFSRQFGVTEEMTEQAMRAFMPAFAAALQRQMADPAGASALFQAMADGPFSNYFDDPAKMFSPSGLADSQKLTEKLFSSSGLLTEVTNQVAAMTGLGIDVAQNMFPVFASMMTGGLAKNMATGPFHEAMQTFMKGFGDQNAGDPMQMMKDMAEKNPFLDAYQSFFSAFVQSPKEPEEPPEPEPGQFKFFDDMVTLGQNMQEDQIRSFNEIMSKFQAGKSEK